jgi:hypothetical protein
MNTSITYRRCQQIAHGMVKDGFTSVERMTWNDIEPYVAMLCGADPRTLEKYRRYLIYFGFFKEVRANVFEWCERDKFNNPVKTVQTDMSLLRVLKKAKTPKRNY